MKCRMECRLSCPSYGQEGERAGVPTLRLRHPIQGVKRAENITFVLQL